jgi:hypothetical protein
LLVDEVSNDTECHEEREQRNDGGGEQLGEHIFVTTFGSHVKNGSVTFEDKHGDADVTEDSIQVKEFDFSLDDFTSHNFLSKVPKDKHHSKGSNDDTN